MDEQARRAVEDNLADVDPDDPADVLRAVKLTFLALAGVIDRDRQESDADHGITRKRVEGVSKLAVALGGSFLVALFGAVLTFMLK